MPSKIRRRRGGAPDRPPPAPIGRLRTALRSARDRRPAATSSSRPARSPDRRSPQLIQLAQLRRVAQRPQPDPRRLRRAPGGARISSSSPARQRLERRSRLAVQAGELAPSAPPARARGRRPGRRAGRRPARAARSAPPRSASAVVDASARRLRRDDDAACVDRRILSGERFVDLASAGSRTATS